MYESLYNKKLTLPEKAVESVKEERLLVYGLMLAEPPALLEAIAGRLRSGDLKKIRLFSGLSVKYATETVLATDLADCVEQTTSFVGEANRGLVQVGLNSYLPNHFYQLPKLISEFMTIDTAITTVSPMDQAGYFTFGVANLKGKSIRDRALAIIELAHPNFREGLLRAAEDMYLL